MVTLTNWLINYKKIVYLYMKNKIFLGFIKFCLLWSILALTLLVSMFAVEYINPELGRIITNNIMWNIDSRFK